jgi:hypothetical protein
MGWIAKKQDATQQLVAASLLAAAITDSLASLGKRLNHHLPSARVSVAFARDKIVAYRPKSRNVQT